MNISFEIAKRYLFGKKSTNAINLITGISVLGIAIGTSALVLILSVFNGFESLITRFLDDFNPDIKVIPKEGKRFYVEEKTMDLIRSSAYIASISKTLEEVALFEYEKAQEVGIIKGVDESYEEVTNLDSTLKEGRFVLKKDDLEFGIIGSILARRLSINIENPFDAVTIYSPRKRKTNPLDTDFKTTPIHPAGIFSIQNENDQEYIITNYSLVDRLLESGGAVTALEIRLKEPKREEIVINQLKEIMGPGFHIQNRYDQDEIFLKIMNLEKWMSFLIVGLTVLIVAFNLVGCLWMIVLDKRFDISILKSLGLSSGRIRSIFIREGVMISTIGLFSGFIFALAFYIAQKQFGLISMSEGFIVDSYPIELDILDFVVVAALVMLIGIFASFPASIRASRIPAFVREE